MPPEDVWTKRIDDLIDEFPNDRFIELLEEMIDRAQVALVARREEQGEEE